MPELRRGQRIALASAFHDAVLSNGERHVSSRGQRWVNNRSALHSGRWIAHATGTALWWHFRKQPVSICGMLVRYPDHHRDTEALLCTDTEAAPTRYPRLLRARRPCCSQKAKLINQTGKSHQYTKSRNGS
ncbi:hypothetical protein [Rhodovastum atsumiense]|nr:hypothetical protein [Rhodovastum atsumiense]